MEVAKSSLFPAPLTFPGFFQVLVLCLFLSSLHPFLFQNLVLSSSNCDLSECVGNPNVLHYLPPPHVYKLHISDLFAWVFLNPDCVHGSKPLSTEPDGHVFFLSVCAKCFFLLNCIELLKDTWSQYRLCCINTCYSSPHVAY